MGSLLFELCSQALHTGKRGRPRKTLPKGVKVRLKNKGSQRYVARAQTTASTKTVSRTSRHGPVCCHSKIFMPITLKPSVRR